MFKQDVTFKLTRVAIGLATFALVFASTASSANSAAADAGVQTKSKLIDLWQPGDSGQRMNIRGRVTSVDGTPLPGINIEIRQPDGDGDWIEQYQTTLTTDSRGRYQFGSVVPESNYCGAPHVSVTVYQPGFEYYDTNIVFEGETEVFDEDGEPVFLEESTVKGETIMFGRFDIVLSPE